MSSKPSDEFAIRVSSVSKIFHLYDKPQDRLKQMIAPRVQRSLGLTPTRYFKEHWALRDVSFEVKRGQTVGIIGRNGAGKSTILQIICGTLSPSAGVVQTQGRVAALLELGSGFNPEFSGRENVFLNAAILGLDRATTEARFAAIEAFADIGEYIDQPVKTYSSGMVVRLAFAVIAHVDAEILIVDEALAVGDVFFTQKCMRFMRDFIKRGTLLFVSHDTGSVQSLCDHAVWLERGELKAAGSPKSICEQYLKALYAENQTVDEAPSAVLKPKFATPRRDARQDFFNASALRNDIEVFRFDDTAESFGVGGAQIISAELCNDQGEPLSFCVGGEAVELKVRARASSDIHQPLVGFVLRDKLGQTLFGENTFASYGAAAPELQAGDELAARFAFHMPRLPAGSYSITLAIASGTQAAHIQHQWMHDAIVLHSQSTSVSSGLVGIPMSAISLERIASPS